MHNRDGHTRDGNRTAINDTGATRDPGGIGNGVSTKRTAGNAGLNEGGKVYPGWEGLTYRSVRRPQSLYTTSNDSQKTLLIR